MFKIFRRGSFFLIFMIIFLMILGCASSSDKNADENNHNNNSNNSNNESPADDVNLDEATDHPDPWSYDGEPATVKMLISVDEKEFANRFKDQIEAEFSNITLELMSADPTNNTYIEELFAKQDIPDIMTVNPNRELVIGLDALEPIDDYIEKTHFDLGIFRENTIENLRSRDPRGENNLYGLPVESMVLAMYYNKDIFDQFGEPYPTNDMTWDEALDVARKLTVEHEGIQYKGLQLSRTNAIPYTQLSIPNTDPETGEVLFANHPDMKRYFDLLDELRSIPGMLEPEEDGFHDGARNYAMWINTAQWVPLLAPVEGFNVDMVSVPTWDDHPDIAPTAVALSFNIVKYSENKDAAWSVISYLASEQGQIHLSKAGSAPTIDSVEAFEQFASIYLEEFDKDYNVANAFLHQSAELAPHSPYGPDVTFHGADFITTKAGEFLTSDQDAVTFLREMGEEYETIVEEMKAQE